MYEFLFVAFLFFAIGYLLWRYLQKQKPLICRTLFPRHYRSKIIIGSRPLQNYTPRTSSYPGSIVTIQNVEGACSICGRVSKAYGKPISCKNSRCSRWYHPKCLAWTIQHGRLRCSCGYQFP